MRVLTEEQAVELHFMEKSIPITIDDVTACVTAIGQPFAVHDDGRLYSGVICRCEPAGWRETNNGTKRVYRVFIHGVIDRIFGPFKTVRLP